MADPFLTNNWLQGRPPVAIAVPLVRFPGWKAPTPDTSVVSSSHGCAKCCAKAGRLCQTLQITHLTEHHWYIYIYIYIYLSILFFWLVASVLRGPVDFLMSLIVEVNHVLVRNQKHNPNITGITGAHVACYSFRISFSWLKRRGYDSLLQFCTPLDPGTGVVNL